MFLMAMFAMGIGWFVASLHVYIRDTAQVVSVVLTLWFWLTPIFIDEKPYSRACASCWPGIRWRTWCAPTATGCFRSRCRN